MNATCVHLLLGQMDRQDSTYYICIRVYTGARVASIPLPSEKLMLYEFLSHCPKASLIYCVGMSCVLGQYGDTL